jgi:DNA replication and repair protein RecF
MHVTKVSLKDFRNFDRLNLELCTGVNILYGDNAQGKTNFLEAVYICSKARSQRAGSDKELIRFGCREAHLQAMVQDVAYSDRIDVHLKRDEKKGAAVNAVPVRNLDELFGRLLTVIFSPEDLSLIKAVPAERRRYMDLELCQLSNIYYYELRQYFRVLKQRNNLLKSLIKKPELKDTVPLWDEQLVAHGLKITESRSGFVQRINEIAREIHASITNGLEKLETVYRPNITPCDFGPKLSRNLDKDILLGSTSVGIHKDDIIFNINGSDARVFGSQGQQRTASLSVKLAEVTLIRERKGTAPVLLLDDVLSELDSGRQLYLLGYIGGIQTILTCTGVEDVSVYVNADSRAFKVENGTITPNL